MTQQYNLTEILNLASAAKPHYSIALPYFDDNYFFRSDYQTIQLDHYDIKQAQEITADSTIVLIDTRTIELNGVEFSITSKFNKPISATMNLAYKAVKIENFERENRHCDATSNSTSISCEPSAVITIDGDVIKLDQEIEHTEVRAFHQAIEQDNRNTSVMINDLAQKWLNSKRNYQLLQRLFNTALDREIYNR